MTATWSMVNSSFKEDRWVRMMALSFCFHLVIFSTFLFAPQTKIHFPSMEERVYHVELVGPPKGIESGKKGKGSASIAKRKEKSYIVKTEARRIAVKKKKSVSVIAKRVSSKPITRERKKDFSAAELVDQAISKIEKKDWSYPVALINAESKKIPEAVIIITVRNDGKILKAWFRKKSNNPLFDDSVLKAIERSDPLPEFPPGYVKSYDEVEINFSLKDLIQQ
jgi:TonB family protein